MVFGHLLHNYYTDAKLYQLFLPCSLQFSGYSLIPEIYSLTNLKQRGGDALNEHFSLGTIWVDCWLYR